jgi:hypothetical protein
MGEFGPDRGGGWACHGLVGHRYRGGSATDICRWGEGEGRAIALQGQKGPGGQVEDSRSTGRSLVRLHLHHLAFQLGKHRGASGWVGDPIGRKVDHVAGDDFRI